MGEENTKDAWKDKLTPEQYRVLREKATEAPFSGKLVHEKRTGMYMCAACAAELFSSDAKFDSGTGWPSFDEPVNLEHVTLKKDATLGMGRTEVLCTSCGGHLGHVFDDGPTDTKKRFCINSLSLDFQSESEGENDL